jgi:hypothetical protein
MALDRASRPFGDAPTYALTDDERAVENHLASRYRKLGISSRHDLPGAPEADGRRPAGSSASTSARASPTHPTNGCPGASPSLTRPAIGSLSASNSSVNPSSPPAPEASSSTGPVASLRRGRCHEESPLIFPGRQKMSGHHS